MDEVERERREKGLRVLGHLVGVVWGLSLAAGVAGVWVWSAASTCVVSEDALAASRLMERVEIHVLRRRALPATLGEVVHPVPVDRHGRPFAYRRLSATSFEVRGRGPDGQSYTDDDVVLVAE